MRSRLVSQVFFSVQSNQRSKYTYNIVGCLYSIRSLFVLYFVQLDNKPQYYSVLETFRTFCNMATFEKIVLAVYYQEMSLLIIVVSLKSNLFIVHEDDW